MAITTANVIQICFYVVTLAVVFGQLTSRLKSIEKSIDLLLKTRDDHIRLATRVTVLEEDVNNLWNSHREVSKTLTNHQISCSK